MIEPFIRQTEEGIQLCSGKPEDMVPFLVVRCYKGKVVFQIPGGSPLEVDPVTTLQFGQDVINLSQKAEAEFRGTTEAQYIFEWKPKRYSGQTQDDGLIDWVEVPTIRPNSYSEAMTEYERLVEFFGEKFLFRAVEVKKEVVLWNFANFAQGSQRR